MTKSAESGSHKPKAPVKPFARITSAEGTSGKLIVSQPPQSIRPFRLTNISDSSRIGKSRYAD